MSSRVLLTLALIVSTATFADESSLSYAEAQVIWQRNRNIAVYQNYSAEFSQFNNHFHLDVKDGCYALSKEPVTLMLVITHPDNDEYAVIKDVLSDVVNAKSECFKRSYKGIQTKVPPFLPFVLQMTMN